MNILCNTSKSSGFSLVELLLALGLTAFISAAAYMLLTQARLDSSAKTNSLNAIRAIEELQHALQNDIRYHSNFNSGGPNPNPVIAGGGGSFTIQRFSPGATSNADVYQATYTTNCYSGNSFLSALNQKLRYLYSDPNIAKVSTCLQNALATCPNGVPYIGITSSGPVYPVATYPVTPTPPPGNTIAMAACFTLRGNELRVTLQSAFIKYNSAELTNAMSGGGSPGTLSTAAARALGVTGKDQIFDVTPTSISIIPQ